MQGGQGVGQGGQGRAGQDGPELLQVLPKEPVEAGQAPQTGGMCLHLDSVAACWQGTRDTAPPRGKAQDAAALFLQGFVVELPKTDGDSKPFSWLRITETAQKADPAWCLSSEPRGAQRAPLWSA